MNPVHFLLDFTAISQFLDAAGGLFVLAIVTVVCLWLVGTALSFIVYAGMRLFSQLSGKPLDFWQETRLESDERKRGGQRVPWTFLSSIKSSLGGREKRNHGSGFQPRLVQSGVDSESPYFAKLSESTIHILYLGCSNCGKPLIDVPPGQEDAIIIKDGVEMCMKGNDDDDDVIDIVAAYCPACCDPNTPFIDCDFSYG